MVLGLISDTHGLLRREAVAALTGVDRIVHAGDVGTPEVLRQLQEIAPTVAVRGNTDLGGWARQLPETVVVEVGRASFYVLHDLEELDLDPTTAGFAGVIFGHTHRPEIRWEGGLLFLNPGSAGPERAGKPVCLALLEVADGRLNPRTVQLVGGPSPPTRG